jgi:hypothetical protein
MSGTAPTLPGRLLCAAECTYNIDSNGNYTPPHIYHIGAGWLANPQPVAFTGGKDNINACLVGLNTDGIVIAFRGTLAPVPPYTPAIIRDWVQDFYAIPEVVPAIPGKVHTGFWNALDTLWDNIASTIKQLNSTHPTAPIYITGHSKGGGLAPICAARFHFQNGALPQPSAVYTFAAPHPGDDAFAAGFPLATIPVTRYENYLDLVPWLAPGETFIDLASKIPILGSIFAKAKGWNYTPVGTLQYIKSDSSIIPDNPALSAVRVAEIVYELGSGVLGGDGFSIIADAHHATCGYGYMKGVCPTGVCP